jgi:hypothetical protein
MTFARQLLDKRDISFRHLLKHSRELFLHVLDLFIYTSVMPSPDEPFTLQHSQMGFELVSERFVFVGIGEEERDHS